MVGRADAHPVDIGLGEEFGVVAVDAGDVVPGGDLPAAVPIEPRQGHQLYVGQGDVLLGVQPSSAAADDANAYFLCFFAHSMISI